MQFWKIVLLAAVAYGCGPIRSCTREVTSAHEAGHVTAGWYAPELRGFRLERVSISLDAMGGCYYGETSMRFDAEKLTADQLLAYLAMTYAGSMNEDATMTLRPLFTDDDSTVADAYAGRWCVKTIGANNPACREEAAWRATQMAMHLLMQHRVETAVLTAELQKQRMLGPYGIQKILGPRPKEKK